MTDVFTKAKRSEVMSRIRGKGNKDTEVALARLFRAHGITGWRRHYAITGRPDFVFPKQKLAVFVDGCFPPWMPEARHATVKKQWKVHRATKLDTSKVRDRRVNRALRAKGWRVLRIWEHELSRLGQSRTLRRVIKALDA